MFQRELINFILFQSMQIDLNFINVICQHYENLRIIGIILQYTVKMIQLYLAIKQTLLKVKQQNQSSLYKSQQKQMQKVPVQKLNMDFPSKNYKKYRSQTKTNPFLNNLNQDAGYPQDVLVNHSTTTSRIQKNYLQDNKKNLKNFFSDRLPPKQAEIFKQSFTIDPAKLFEIKKKQHQMKTLTRSKLEEKLNSTITSSKLNPNKISQIFQLNDKNQDFKKKFLGNQSVRISQPYQRQNHLRGTTSYIKKYSNLIKKNAYQSVFGPEKSATKRHSFTARTNRQPLTYSRPFTTANNINQKFNPNTSSKQLERKRFSSLIQKIDKHRQGLDPQNKRSMRPYIPPQQPQDNQANKNYMITWIKDTTKVYKYQSIDDHAQRINEIQDLQKIDKQFYDKMKLHKARRLEQRQSLVQNIDTNKNKTQTGQIGSRNNWLSHRNNSNKNSLGKELSISLNDEDQLSISSQDLQEGVQFQQAQRRRTGASLLSKFIRHLVDAIQQARFFGIQDKQNMYKAFWQEADPFDKSGSYAFFKAIKRNDIEGVKKFIAADADFLYQRDHKGRSPLIYAVQNNHNEMVNLLLQCDININKGAFNFKTALYYAIQNQNAYLVKKLLQAGALPWSTSKCSYKSILQKSNNPRIVTLIKNARKIAIIVKMHQKKPQQIAAWNRLKQKITEQAFVNL